MEIQAQINSMASTQGGTVQATPKQPQENNYTIQDTLSKVKQDSGYVPTIQEKTIINAIEHANKKLEGSDKQFQFSVHEKTKQIMIKVIDKGTQNVIREIPSEKILDMIAAMCDAAGIFVDEKR